MPLVGSCKSFDYALIELPTTNLQRTYNELKRLELPLRFATSGHPYMCTVAVRRFRPVPKFLLSRSLSALRLQGKKLPLRESRKGRKLKCSSRLLKHCFGVEQNGDLCLPSIFKSITTPSLVRRVSLSDNTLRIWASLYLSGAKGDDEGSSSRALRRVSAVEGRSNITGRDPCKRFCSKRRQFGDKRKTRERELSPTSLLETNGVSGRYM